jgi:two-component system, chemotaxis family, CheB/CheR fusion protein
MSDQKGGSGASEETGPTDRSSQSAGAEPDRSPQGDHPGGGEADPPRLIVGVGASAGGLEAFTELLRNLPSDTGMAFVLVQHLDPHHASILADLLANYTRMPVLQVHGDVPVEPNNVRLEAKLQDQLRAGRRAGVDRVIRRSGQEASAAGLL